MVYGDTGSSTIDQAVRWLIIVFIFVFDPLAVLLLIAANFSFQNRHNHGDRQEEIFDALFAKEEKKSLDKAVKKDDNESIEVSTNLVEGIADAKHLDRVQAGKREYILREKAIDNASIEELEREINTRKERNNPGWLDDLDK
jgi:hypothetical protein